MQGLNWLLRMARWSRRPPSMARVKLFLAVLGLCLVLALLQWAGYWPDWLVLNPRPKLKLH